MIGTRLHIPVAITCVLMALYVLILKWLQAIQLVVCNSHIVNMFIFVTYFISLYAENISRKMYRKLLKIFYSVLTVRITVIHCVLFFNCIYLPVYLFWMFYWWKPSYGQVLFLNDPPKCFSHHNLWTNKLHTGSLSYFSICVDFCLLPLVREQ